MRKEFSVLWWDIDGGQHSELSGVTAIAALARVRQLVSCPAAKRGVIQRVVITDGAKSPRYEWEFSNKRNSRLTW